MDAFKNIGIFSVSKTHLSTDDEAQAQIDDFTFIGKSRASGEGGGVDAYISSSVPFHRRLDLKQEDIERIWLEILFPKTKGLLIGIIYSITLQIRQNISVQILIANLIQCCQLCHQKTKNAF